MSRVGTESKPWSLFGQTGGAWNRGNTLRDEMRSMASVQRAERGEGGDNRSVAPPPSFSAGQPPLTREITSGQVIYASIVAFLA